MHESKGILDECFQIANDEFTPEGTRIEKLKHHIKELQNVLSKSISSSINQAPL